MKNIKEVKKFLNRINTSNQNLLLPHLIKNKSFKMVHNDQLDYIFIIDYMKSELLIVFHDESCHLEFVESLVQAHIIINGWYN